MNWSVESLKPGNLIAQLFIPISRYSAAATAIAAGCHLGTMRNSNRHFGRFLLNL